MPEGEPRASLLRAADKRDRLIFSAALELVEHAELPAEEAKNLAWEFAERIWSENERIEAARLSPDSDN